MAENLNSKVSPSQFDDLSSPLVLDLIAVFKLMEEEVMKIISEGEKENITPEELIRRVEEII